MSDNITKLEFEKMLAKRCKHIANEQDVIAIFNILIDELKNKLFFNKEILLIKNFFTLELKNFPSRKIQNIYTKEYQVTKPANKLKFKVKKSIYKFLVKYLDINSISKVEK